MNLKQIFVFFVLSDLLFEPINSQNSIIFPMSGSVAETSTSDITHIAPFVNPSLYAYQEGLTLGLSYDNRFIIPQLSTKSIYADYDMGLLNAGLSMSYDGYSLFNECVTGVIFARNFSDKFALGIGLNYYTVYFNAANCYRGAFFPQVGFTIKLHSNLYLSGNIYNPYQSDIRTELSVMKLPSIFSLGTCYYFHPDFVGRIQLDKEVSSNYRFACGFDYTMLQKVVVKTGIYHNGILIPCIGLEWKEKYFSVSLNAELHALLGLNAGTSLCVYLPKH